ncbi:MAG: AI-2E family transporter [Xenococcus sp. (in: cyanobacteria)]
MLNSKEQFPLVIRWGLLFPIIFLNGWLLWLLFNFLQPFTNILITAALFAFLLNFPIGWLQKLGFQRGLAVILVFILAILLLATLGLIIIPLLAQQLNELLSSLPQLINSGSQQWQNLEQWVSEQQLFLNFNLNQELAFNLGKVFTQAAQKLSEALKSLSNQVFIIIFGTINGILKLKILVAAIVVGQINDNVVAPRLIGEMTGLNPVWLILALLIGGKLAGILGLLIAVPFASVIKKSVDQIREIRADGELALINPAQKQ